MAEQYGHPFAHLLSSLRKGALLDDAAEALEELLEAVQETDKPGTLTLKLTLKPQGDGAVIVTDQVTSGKPRPEAGATLMFAINGSLSRRDPRQPELPFAVEETARGTQIDEGMTG